MATLPAAVLSALETVQETDEFRQMERLSQLTGVEIPANLRGLETRSERHTGVIAKDKMLGYVMGL